MIISRRQFLKYCSIAAGAIGLTATDLMKLENALAKSVGGGLPVIWIAGQACTGCSTSLLNSVYFATIEDVLLLGPDEGTLELKFHETVMGAMSNEATQVAGLTDEAFALVVEGAITPQAGYCEIGSYVGAASENMADVVSYLANHANCARILAVGTCASFGGIPAANGNATGAMGVLAYANSISPATYKAWRAKTVNIPGCPPNPNWVVGTVASLLANGLKVPQLDALRRPKQFYGQRICGNCDRFATSLTGQVDGFVGATATRKMVCAEPDRIGDPAQNVPGGRCLKKAGCKGSKTKSDCSSLKWHSPTAGVPGVNWCVGAGAPCQGCVQNTFPDRMSPFLYIK